MTAKHTSGPWWRDDDGFVAAGSGDTYVTVADFDCSPDIDIDEREANKALAIAAPDMLEALKALWSFASSLVERHGMNGDDSMTDTDHAFWQDCGGAANAAITKAETAPT